MPEQARRAFDAPVPYLTVIGGQFRAASGASMMTRERPAHGDVVSHYPASTRADAEGAISVARIANDPGNGLAAYVWTDDLSTVLSCSGRIRATRVRMKSVLGGVLEMPLGGGKQSRNGRETGRYGIEEHTGPKSVHLQVGCQSERWVEGA